MNYLAYHESKTRGTFDFPLEYHYVDPSHPRYQMPFHWHIEYELIFVHRNSFKLMLDAETITLKAGDAALVPDGVIHGGMPQDCIYECIVFDFSRFMQENTIGRKALMEILGHTIQVHHYFPKGSQEAGLVASIFSALNKRLPGYEFITTGLLWQLMGTVVEARSAQTILPLENKDLKRIELMKKVLRRIRKDYSQPLTLNDLASEANMAPKYFCRAFRQVTGRTPIDYLNYYRIQCAGERMIVTNDTITDIAMSCGFNDLSYFAKAFKKYKGVSTKQYRAGQQE